MLKTNKEGKDMVFDRIKDSWYIDYEPVDWMEITEYSKVPTEDGRSSYYHLTIEGKLSDDLTDIEIVGAAITGVLYGFIQIRGTTIFHTRDVQLSEDRVLKFTTTAIFGEIRSVSPKYY